MKEKDGFTSYKKHIEGSSLYAFKGEGIINSPIEKIVGILLDNDNATKWVPRLKFCMIAERQNMWPMRFVQYSIFDAPWPVKDRYFLSEVNVDINTAKTRIVITYKNIDDMQPFWAITPPLKAIKGNIDGSQYTLVKRLNGVSTDFTAISIVQPNGNIPTWLINWVGESMPFDTIKRLKRRLNDPSLSPQEDIKKLFIHTQKR